MQEDQKPDGKRNSLEEKTDQMAYSLKYKKINRLTVYNRRILCYCFTHIISELRASSSDGVNKHCLQVYLCVFRTITNAWIITLICYIFIYMTTTYDNF
jgi:hypothetical protein